MKLNKYFSRLSLLIFTLLLSIVLFAQDKPVEMADAMRSNGKIYVVVTVCLIILVGLFIYVMGIDRKLRKLEREKV